MKVTKTVDEWGVILYRNENGKLHREDGPAIIDGDYKAWCINGKRHRGDGPAIQYPNGDVEYWLNGEHYTEEEFELEVLKRKLEKIKGL